jgi:hypothetical protein
MTNALRRRFWLEAGMAVVTAVLFLVTLVQRDWIELLFRVDPDHANGSLEWTIVAALVVATLALSSLATYEWRRAAAIRA